MAKPKTPRKSDKTQPDTKPIEDAEVVEPAPQIEEPVPETLILTDEAVTKDKHGPAPALEIPEQQPRAGGFFALLIGGAIAAAVGYGVSEYVNQRAADGRAFLEAAVSDSARRIDAIDGRFAELEAEITEVIAARTSAITESDLDAQIIEVLARLEAVNADIGARVSALELRPMSRVGEDDNAALAAFQSKFVALQRKLDAQAAEIAALRDATDARAVSAQIDAQAAALDLTARAALLRVQAALDSGGGFSKALDTLEGATGETAPEALRGVAEDGVPALAELRRGFASAARAALNTARLTPASGSTTERVAAFLQNQLGARSLEVREGNSADAILSRAEAALRGGDLWGALSELETLPEASGAEMADWQAEARSRLAALEAVEALTQRLNSN